MLHLTMITPEKISARLVSNEKDYLYYFADDWLKTLSFLSTNQWEVIEHVTKSNNDITDFTGSSALLKRRSNLNLTRRVVFKLQKKYGHKLTNGTEGQ